MYWHITWGGGVDIDNMIPKLQTGGRWGDQGKGASSAEPGVRKADVKTWAAAMQTYSKHAAQPSWSPSSPTTLDLHTTGTARTRQRQHATGGDYNKAAFNSV